MSEIIFVANAVIGLANLLIFAFTDDPKYGIWATINISVASMYI